MPPTDVIFVKYVAATPFVLHYDENPLGSLVSAFVMTGNSGTIHDNEKVLFTFDNKAISRANRKYLKDADGTEILQIRNKHVSIHKEAYLCEPDGSKFLLVRNVSVSAGPAGRFSQVGVVKHGMEGMKTYNINYFFCDSKGKAISETPDYTCTNNLSDGKYEIVSKEGVVVASIVRVARQGQSHKLNDSYDVSSIAGQCRAFISGLTIVTDRLIGRT